MIEYSRLQKLMLRLSNACFPLPILECVENESLFLILPKSSSFPIVGIDMLKDIMSEKYYIVTML